MMPLIRLLFLFEGRITRAKYWLGVFGRYGAWLAALLLLPDDALFATGLSHAQAQNHGSADFTPLFYAMAIAHGWIAMAMAVKRAHDRGRSGGFVLLEFVPLLQIWPAIELGFFRGTAGPNRFGQDPLGREAPSLDEIVHPVWD